MIVADVGKGYAACSCGRLAGGDLGAHVAGGAAVAGHCYPVWTRFRGGKGVATSFGQCLYTFPAFAPLDVALAVAALSVQLDGEAFDERTGNADDFYARLERGAEAKTSQPSPAAFADAYAEAASRGKEHVLSIHLDARISGTAHSAELAARKAEIPVTVVDTRTVSYGVGACGRAAARLVEAGASPREAARRARELGGQMENAFVARGGSGGRVPGGEGWTVLTFTNGATTAVASRGSAHDAIDAMAALVDDDRAVEAAVGYAGSAVEDSADLLAAMVGRSPHVVSVERYRVGPSIGAHTGPISFGLFW